MAELETGNKLIAREKHSDPPSQLDQSTVDFEMAFFLFLVPMANIDFAAVHRYISHIP